MPAPSVNWHLGRFQLIINYCHNCFQHQNTSIHEEADFGEKANRLAQALKGIFPNIEIQANYDMPLNKIEYFDVYVRGNLFYQSWQIAIQLFSVFFIQSKWENYDAI